LKPGATDLLKRPLSKKPAPDDQRYDAVWARVLALDGAYEMGS
jgi:hypothetical protein